MEGNWEQKIKKWGRGIKLEDATGDDIQDYLDTKIYQYEVDKTGDSNLWDLFQDDFKNFSPATFSRVDRRKLQRLRHYLRCGGVYVAPNHKNLTIAQTLIDVIEEDIQHVWSMDDIEKVREDLENGPITSIFISLEGNRRLTPLPRGPQALVYGAPPPLPRSHQQKTEPLEPTNLPSTGRLISDIAKIYTDEQKYDGTNGSFDHKLTIFTDICQRVELPEIALMKAFPTMLKGLAQDHFYNNQLSKRTYEEACTNLRSFFEGPGFHRRSLDEWNSITLASITAKNPDKSTYENVQLLINQLRQLQYSLSANFRNTEFLHNKLITACQGSPACRYAVSDPPNDLGHLINKLQSSITSYEKEQEQNTESFFTDRRYHGRDLPYNNRPENRNEPNRYGSNRSIPYKPHGKCFVCKKPRCRSWKHTPQEQQEAKDKFKAKYGGRFNSNTRDFDKRFNNRLTQYITEHEGDGDSEDELNNTFEALMIDVSDSEPERPNDNCRTDTTTYITSFGSLSIESAATTAGELANRAFIHQMTSDIPKATTDTTDTVNDTIGAYKATSKSRYNSEQFYGIMIDTGASKHSTAGYGQFQALQRTDKSVKLDETTKGMVTVQFGIGTTSSIGSATVTTPIGQVEFHIVQADTPFLLSLADMDQLGVYLNNLTNTLVSPSGNVPVVRRFGHLFLLWNASLESFLFESFNCNPCFLTNVELQRLHRRFGHPSVSRLQRILDRAGHEVDKKALDYLSKYCAHCQRYGQSPGRFKFTLRDDVNFNYSIIVDIMYLNGKPVLHIVDEGTRYQAGKWLQNISAKHTWDTLRMCWIDTYLGPPDNIAHDAGTNFISKEFRQYANAMGITLKAVPVEAHNSIGIVERYHATVRRAYQIISAEIPDINKEMALQMAFKAINDSTGPDGLVPTLLVYGAYPRMSEYDPPSPTITQRAMAIKKAMVEINKLRAERQVADAINTRNGPNTTAIHGLPLNSQVLVWREGNIGKNGSWEGPYNLVSTDGESCVLALPHGNTTFRTTVVKPYLTPSTTVDGIDLPDPNTVTVPTEEELTAPEIPIAQKPPEQPAKRGRGRPRKYPLPGPTSANQADIRVFLQDELPQYAASRQLEISGLLEKGVFEVALPSDVPAGTRIFNARFVDEIKNKGTEKAFEKSRLVVQAYNDGEKQIVLTQSPTIQRVSQRIILCIAAMATKEDVNLYLRDISQAYVQSTTLLNRSFYIRPPTELAQQLGLQEGAILRVVKPLYGVPEAGNHWFKTYHSHHVKELSMDQSTYDPCLLFSVEPFGIVGLQTDDTLFLGDAKFAEQEQEQLQKAGFSAKERECLTPTKNLKFNGGVIQLQNDGITLTQERQCGNLKPVSDKLTNTVSSRGAVRQNLGTKEQYVAQRARGAYIASVCQPEAAFDLSVAAQAITPTDEDVKALNKRLQWQIENAARGIRYVKLERESLRLLVFTDASFANNKDYSSQMGYILVLADAKGRANILHWSSIKCKRVTRSVLASELYSMAHGFDIGASVKSTIEKALTIDLPLILCTDSKSLYDCLVKLGTTREKRLMIDVMCLRQAYERREITEVKWIQGDTNPADSMTKTKPSNALKRLLDTNMLELEVVEWVERGGMDTKV